MLHEALDGAALARRVAALEHDDVPMPIGVEQDRVVIIVVLDAVAVRFQSHRQKVSTRVGAEVTRR